MPHHQEQPPESFQDIPEIEEGGLESGDIHRFQMLHLNSTPPGHHQFTAAATTTPSDVRVRPLERCTSCGSIKRRSPSSVSSLQEPSSKRAALRHPVTTNANACNDGNQNDSLGSGKLPLDNAATSPTPMQPPSSNTKQTVLNRSLSDITSSMGTQEIEETNAHVQALNSQSAENSKINSMSASPSPAAGSLPPLPPVLHRSLSEPIPSDYQPVAESTPSRPPAARTFVPSPSSDQESSNSKRLRRIKERMKQMSQWVEKVASEEDTDEDTTCSENDNTSDKNPKEMSENEPETRPDQEAVRVEESGGNLIVRFKCPCGKGYEIFLSGKKCYYRLT